MSAKRFREHLSLFASLFAVVGIVSGLGAGLVGFVDLSSTQGVRAELATRVGSDVGLRLGQRLAADPEAQDAAMRAIVAGQFGDLRASIFRTVSSSAVLESVTHGTPDAPAEAEEGDGEGEADPPRAIPPRVSAWSLPDLDEVATLDEGRWATAPDEATAQADAAERLGLEVGDVLSLGEIEVTLTGTWTADDAYNPRWMGDPLLLDGYSPSKEMFGPIIIDESQWAKPGTVPSVRWVIAPDTSTITAHQLETVSHGWAELLPAARAAGMRGGSIEQDGRFSFTVDRLLVRVHALEAVKPVVLLILAAIAVVTLLELARLLAELRAVETELLWSRGATPLDLAGSTAVETAAVSLAGVAVGAGAAGAVLFALGGADGLDAAGSALWAVPLAAGVGAVLIFAVQAFRSARLSARRDAPDRSGRRGQLTAAGLVVLVTLAAALAVWQLQLYGSPVTPVAGGGTQVDPITVAAPALVLVALVLIGLLVFPFAAPAVERLSSGRSDAGPVLAARSVARRGALVATPLVIVALASGQLVIAGGYSATWQSTFTTTQELRAGSATRVQSAYAPTSDATITAMTATPGVTAIAPVDLGELKIADEYISIVGIAPRAIAELSTSAGGAVDPRQLAADVDRGTVLPVLPGDTGELELSADISGFAPPESVTVWLRDDYGLSRAVALENQTPDAVADPTATVRYAGELPDTVGPEGAWRLAAIELEAGPPPLPFEQPAGDSPKRIIELVELSRGGDAFDLGGDWGGWAISGTPSRTKTTDSGHGIEARTGGLVRMLPPSDEGEAAEGSAVPVVISAALASHISAEKGDLIPLALIENAMPVGALVADIVPAIPSAPDASAVLVDLAVLDAVRLRGIPEIVSPTLHWIGGDSTAVGAALRDALPRDIAVRTLAADPDRPMLAAGAIALWLAAAGCTVLALAAIGAVVRAQLRSRRGEVVVLRTIGVSSSIQGAIRRGELWIVTAFATLVGLVAGVVTVATTGASLARAAVPGPYQAIPTVPQFEPLWLPLALVVLLALIGAVIALYARSVSRQARSAHGDEVVR